MMGHGYRPDKFRGRNKKKLAIAALFVGIILLVILVMIGIIIVAIINVLLGQVDTSIGQNVGNIIQTLWTYATDLIEALCKQIIANPLQLITGGSN